ncbi:Uncharacterized protein SCF082_LOCUS43762, partial [Durusdinium trenchii]
MPATLEQPRTAPLPSPQSGESNADFVWRVHNSQPGKTDAKTAMALDVWRNAKEQDLQEAARQRFPTSKFVCHPNRCVFVEHTTKRKTADPHTGEERDEPVVYDRSALEAICDRCNERILDTGDFSPLIEGHTPDQYALDRGAKQPPVLGYAGPYRVGLIGNKNPRWAIFCDEYWHRDELPKLEKLQRRSPEVWMEDRMEDRFFDPIACLGAETPRLDMGLTRFGRFFHCRGTDGAMVHKYSAPAAGLPGANSVYVPGETGDDETSRYAADDDSGGQSMALGPDDIRQIVDAIMELPVIQWAQENMEAQGMGTMNDGDGDGDGVPGEADPSTPPAPPAPQAPDSPPAAPAPAPPSGPPAAPNPMDPEQNSRRRYEAGDEDEYEDDIPVDPAPAGDAYQPDDEDHDMVTRYMSGDCDDEEMRQYMAGKRQRYMSGAGDDSGMDAPPVDPMPAEPPTENYSRQNRTLRDRVRQLERRERESTRYSKLMEKRAQGYAFDPDEELRETADMNDAQFARHLQRIERYERAPVNYPALPTPELDRTERDRERYQRRVNETAEQIARHERKNGREITYDDARRKAEEQLRDAVSQRLMSANGTIRRARFVTLDTSDNNAVIECNAQTRPIGISQIGSRETPLPNVSTADRLIAANSGEQLEVHTPGNSAGRHDISLEIGTGGCTTGDLLVSDADGKGVVESTEYTQFIGAVALESASSGELAKVMPVFLERRDDGSYSTVTEFDCETGSSTDDVVLIPAALNTRGWIVAEVFARVTEVFAGSSEDQGVVTVKDEDDNTLYTLTASDAAADAENDLIVGYFMQAGSTGDALKTVASGKAVEAALTQETSGGSPAGKMSDFAVNEYVQIVPVKKSTGLYLNMTIEECARIVNADLADFQWPDGADAPQSFDAVESFEWLNYLTKRYAYDFVMGNKTVEQATWEIDEQHLRIQAQKAMTARTLKAITALTTSGNYDSSHVSNPEAIAGNTGKWDESTTARQDVRNSLNYAAETILLDTNGAVNEEDLKLVIGPTLARKLAKTQEIVDYIKGSPDALNQIKEGGKNARFGLPNTLYGWDVVVEKTVRVTSRKGASSTSRSFILTDSNAIMTARPGSLEGVADAPNFSTCSIFMYEEMTVEKKQDADHRRLRGRVVEDYDVKMTAPVSGFLFTNVAETHSVVTTALDDASGKIKGALRKGNRYLPADLSALTGESLALLKRITCDIAMALLLDRRIDADADQSQKRHERAERYLEQIAAGDIVFDVDDVIEASNAEHIEHTEIDLVTTDKHLLRQRTKNYYPVGGVQTIKVDTGTSNALETLGKTANGIQIREQVFRENVPGDANGGDAGPPIDIQYHGEIHIVTLEFTYWDDSIMAKVIPKLYGGTAGAVGTAGTLWAADSKTYRLLMDGSGFTRNYLRAIPTDYGINEGGMWDWLAGWWKRLRDGRKRAIYRYFDGRTYRRVDPMVAHSRLLNHETFDIEGHTMIAFQDDATDEFSRKAQDEARGILVAAVRDVFEVTAFDPRTGTGLTEGECVGLLWDFFDYCNAEKKSTDLPPNSPESTEQPPSATSTIGPDSGSISTSSESAPAEPKPSPLEPSNSSGR